jgi:hypothetical protein
VKLRIAVGAALVASTAAFAGPATAGSGSNVTASMIGCNKVKVSVPRGMTADVTVSGCKITGIVTGSRRAVQTNGCGPATYSADVALGYSVFGAFITGAEATDFNHYFWICNSETITNGWSTGGCYGNSSVAGSVDRCWNIWVGGNFKPPSYIVSSQYAVATNYNPLGYVGSSDTGQMNVNFAVDAYQGWRLNAWCYWPNNMIGFSTGHCQIH